MLNTDKNKNQLYPEMQFSGYQIKSMIIQNIRIVGCAYLVD